MSLPSVDQVALITGKISFNCTDLTQPYPHGGTGLGLVKDLVLRPTRTYSTLTAEEFGVEAIEVIDLGSAAILAATMRTFDDDAINALFPGTTTGTSSGNKVVNWPPTAGTYRAGSLVSGRSIKLVFTPDDTDRHPMTILYKALPLVEESAQLTFNLAVPMEIGVVFVGIRDSTNRVYAQGKKEDLSL